MLNVFYVWQGPNLFPSSGFHPDSAQASPQEILVIPEQVSRHSKGGEVHLWEVFEKYIYSGCFFFTGTPLKSLENLG